ncbi:MAG: hypothetical protein ABIY70_14855 [Capsulimonas sp.]|uniref:hypothetical protein n=1 Tax=Capsulimonas sp. TaxID=2494211 RepID=UPI003263C31E
MKLMNAIAVLGVVASTFCCSPAALALSPQTAEADARITAFTMEALKAQIGDKAFTEWPAPLRDSLVYTLSPSPASEWSPEIRARVLRQFRNHEAVLTPYKVVDQWLAKPDPLADATLWVRICAGITKSSKIGLSDVGVQVDFIPDSHHDAQKGAAFFDSLTAEQKKKYFNDTAGQEGGLPVSDFSPEQIKLLEDFYYEMIPVEVNGKPSEPLRLHDGRVRIGISIQAVVATHLDGKEQILCANLADLLALRETPKLIKAEREAER